MARSAVAAAGAVIVVPLMASPAWSATTCGTPGNSTQAEVQAPGFSCTVDIAGGELTFRNFVITQTLGTFSTLAAFGPGTISAFAPGTAEAGLTLNKSVDATGSNVGGVVTWNYIVSSTIPLDDTQLQVAGQGTAFAGNISTVERLATGGTPLIPDLTLSGIGSTDLATFAPQEVIEANKTSTVGTGPGSSNFARESSITNFYSPVPGPIVGAGLPGLLAALGGLVAMARRRRNQLA